MSSKEKGWKEISIAGVCSKSSVGFMTGDWKTYMPVTGPGKMHNLLNMRYVLS